MRTKRILWPQAKYPRLPRDRRRTPSAPVPDQRDKLTSVESWLLAPELYRLSIGEFVTALAERLRADGIQIVRISTSLRTKHPELFSINPVWSLEDGCVLHQRANVVIDTAYFVDSPVAELYKGGGPIRCSLRGPTADLRYPVCRDLAREGCTDYLVLPLEMVSGQRSFMSFATDCATGFSDAELARLIAMGPAIAPRIEIEAAYYAMRCLLEVYLGKNAAARVMAGKFKRGGGESMRAAIWTCDLRGFTKMADRLPAAEVVATLDRFFQRVAGPIDSYGGEVLKFIGDAVLAIFPIGTDDAEAVCRHALAAARAALSGIAELNRESGSHPLELGIALHVGEVMYGNIGARERLDFTVIGAAVNEVCRVESLCKSLGVPLLSTAAFVGMCPDPGWRSLGRHELRGVSEPQELYTV